MNDTPHQASPRIPRGELIARNVLFLTVGQILSTALGIALTATMGRTLGPSDFGVCYIIMTIAGFLSVIVDWGQSTFVLKEISRGRSDQAHLLGSAVLTRSALIFGSAAISAGVAIVVGYPAIVAWLTPLAIIFGLPGSLYQLLSCLFRGKDRTELDVAAGLVGKLVAVIATILALLAGGGLVAAVLMPAVGGLAGLAFGLSLARGLGIEIWRPVGHNIRELLVEGAPIAIMAFCISARGFIDITLLSLLVPTDVVGWYGAARTFIGILLVPASILGMASFPELCRASQSPADLRQLLSASSRLLMAAGSFAFCIVFSFADVAVNIIYGSNHFDPTALILKVNAPFLLIFFLNFMLANTAIAIEKSTQIARITMVCAGISAILSWFLISFFQSRIGNGAVGLMISTCLTELLMTAGIIAILPRGIVAGTILLHLLRAYASAAIVLVLAEYILADVTVWVSLPIVTISFVAVSLLTKLISFADIRTIAMLLQSILTKLRLGYS
ncbi:MAG: oligosaccharide flippase family protein [Hyphomicrobiaceae bacterium]